MPPFRILKTVSFGLILFCGLLAAEVSPPPLTLPKLDQEATLRLLNGGPGRYDFYKFDKSALQKMYFEQVFKKQDEDYRYFLATLTSIEKGYADLLIELYKKEDPKADQKDGLFQISRKHVLAKETEFIDARDFAVAIDSFNKAKEGLEARIETLTAIANGFVPSAENVEADGSGIKKVVNYGQQNFDPIKKFYSERLALITKFASDLPHNIMLPGGVPLVLKAGSGKGLVIEYDNAFVRITSAKLIELKQEVLKLRTWGKKAEDALSEYTRYLMDRIFAFNDTYGKGERMRILGKVEQEKRDKEVREILGMFWSRSYLRSIYGMPVGAIGASYDKAWWHLDVFKFSTTALLNLHEHPVFDSNEMVEIEQNYRNLLRRADVRSEKILDGNLGFIGTIENITTFLSGRRNEAVAAQAMLRLLAADMFEERLMLDSGSLSEMVERYRQRYFSNEQDEIFFRRMQIAYGDDPEVIREKYTAEDRLDMIPKILGAEKDQAFQGPAGFGTGENLRAKFENVLIYMEGKLEDLNRARIIEAQIANALNPNNQFRLKVNARKRNL